METRENRPGKKPVLALIADKLLETQKELDELALQFALGKAEARDKFEDIKVSLKDQLHSLKSKVNQGQAQAIGQRFKAHVDELELQLALGKAETKEMFEEQRRKILKALDAFEENMKRSISDIYDTEEFYHEMEKFKLKLEIIRLKFTLKKFLLKESFHDGMKEAGQKVTTLTAGLQARWEAGHVKLDGFRDEIHLAYRHLRKAIQSL